MELKEIIIRNYRAIENACVKLNYPINPIVGVNESGKTTILKAILCLDQGQDRRNKGEHLEYQNKYLTKDTINSSVSVKLKLTLSEIKELISFCNVDSSTEDYKYLSSLSKENFITYSRLLSEDKEYTVDQENITTRLKKKICKFIKSKFPVFLYFDDFSDRVPEEINFPEEYLKNPTLKRNKQREWQEIIKEIFKRADLEAIENGQDALSTFLSIDDSDRKDDVLSDIEDVLNSEIIEEWKKIKKRGATNLADDSENLALKLDNPEPLKFLFKVKDKSKNSRKRTFTVSQRSKGFQWFFNYMIKLKFNPRYKQSQENSIFLLDEPGSYLHSSAQTELLKELKNVSKTNKIIYCTHSQFLLNPNDIKLGSIKIARKESAVIDLILFGNSQVKKDQGALSPVYQALNLNYANNFLGNLLITEGITDFYFFKMLQKFWKRPNENIKIIPGSGSGNLTHAISLGLGFADKFKVIFDNDRGLEAITKYEKEFGEIITRNFLTYHSDIKNFKLENHLSKVDKDLIKEITGVNKLKNAIPCLFLDFEQEIGVFLNALSEESKTKIEKTLELIENHFN